MIRSRAVRFLLLVTGLVLVLWVFVIGLDESLLGTRRARDPARPDREAPAPPRQGGDVALRNANIPVREPTEDGKGRVLQYLVHVGETVGDVGDTMRARDVSIDVYNKELPPDERVIARIHGTEALIAFRSPPDPASGFRGAEVEEMTLSGDVRVEYLSDDGGPATTLTSNELRLRNDDFSVPGRASIAQEGLRIEGEGLRYDRVSGAFSFERNVHVEGTRFDLPTAASERGRDEDVAEGTGAARTPRTISCAGRLTFAPAQEEPTGGKRAKSAVDGGVATIGGGVLTFEDHVVGTQDGATLDCARLEIVLANESPAEGQQLRIERVLALGADDAPARLTDPRGTFEAGRLSLDETDAGRIVSLLDAPRIRDARFGGAPNAPRESVAEGGDAESRFDAGAERSIRFLPAADDGAAMRLELRGDAFLASRGADASRDFRIEGETLDLLVAREPGAEGAPERLAFRELTAREEAHGTFASGRFHAAEIVVRPRDAAANAVAIVLRPDPVIELDSVLAGGGTRTTRVVGTGAVAEYEPPAAAGEPARARFTGPTAFEVIENGATVTRLFADERVEIALAPEDDATSFGRLDAFGNVRFESVAQGVRGSGSRLVLEPGAEGSFRVDLFGAPAEVVLAGEQEGDPENRVRASTIRFDPERRVLHATESVEARLAGGLLSVEGEDAAAARAEASETAGGMLRCADLVVQLPPEDAPERTLVLDATGGVTYVDEARGLSAAGARLRYEQAAARAQLHGGDDAPATVTRRTVAAGGGEHAVTVGGPLVDLDQESTALYVPRGGFVRMDEGGAAARSVTARCSGALEFRDERLDLDEDVVLAFQENDVETRALWCDAATALFTPAEAGADAGGLPGGFERFLARGRVHVAQSAPRAITGGGSEAEWVHDASGGYIELRGTRPPCWIESVADGRLLRQESDRIRLFLGRDEIESGASHSVLAQVRAVVPR